MTSFRTNWADTTLDEWLRGAPTEDDLRLAYIALETKRADLWTAGHIDSFRRDRYEVDARYVRQLVQVKRALARHWTETGQLDQAAGAPS
jgi:hypothetical protein